jgi:hypothetical protein
MYGQYLRAGRIDFSYRATGIKRRAPIARRAKTITGVESSSTATFINR